MILPICPICKGPVWDNRAKKASGEFSAKSPDFVCKDKTCDGAIWPPKPGEIPAVEVPTQVYSEPVDDSAPRNTEEEKQLRIAKESIFKSIAEIVSKNLSIISMGKLTLEDIDDAIMEETERVVKQLLY